MTTQVEVREHLVRALQQDLVGPMREDEVLPQRPSRWYLTGFLVPQRAPDEQRHDPLADEELAGGAGDEADDDQGDDPPAVARAFFPSSIGVSVVCPDQAQTLKVIADWGEYRELEPDECDRLEAEFRAAREAEREPGEGDPAPAADAEEGARAAPPRPRRTWWQRSPRTSQAIEVPLEDGTRRHALLGGEDLQVVVQARAAVAPGLPGGARVVSVFLVNDKEPLGGSAADARTLFQTELQLECEAGFLPRTDWTHEGSDDPDEARTDLQFRRLGEWAVGHGVSTVAGEPGPSGRVRRVQTTWFPTADVHRMTEAAAPNVVLGMEELAGLVSPAALTTAVEPMLTAYGDWIEERRGTLEGLSPARHGTGTALLALCERAIARIRRGLAYLDAHADAFKAFQLANRAMALQARRARPAAYQGDVRPAWRLFQLAFLLLNVEGVADPSSPDRDVTDLLFFPTGGGKTEAYFGVAAFAMLLRRMRHRDAPHGGAGVTVLLRYTLRLLTLDQLERAATLTCALERLRVERPDRLGTQRFQVGLWVGRRATPNTLKEADRQARDYRLHPDDPRKAPPVPLTGCPWCGTEFRPGSFHMVKRGREPIALRVGCLATDEATGGPACDFAFDRTDGLGLPLVVVDEQVYRELPTFLIGTVDKFAALPWRGAAGAIFGRVQAVDREGFYGHAVRPPRGAERLRDGLPPPDLIIQDELHLISGPLGTMVGLYETVVDTLSRDREGRRPKLLASTATARRAQTQIRALYARSQTELFPPQGPDVGDTFFAHEDTAPERSRRYLGVAAPGRSMKALAVRVYSALLGAGYWAWYRAAQAGRSGLDNPADTYATLVSYFNTLRELGGAQRLVGEEVAPRAFHLERRHPLQETRSAVFKNRRLGFDILELTSRQSTDDIRKAKARLEAAYSSENRNDVLLASSMISVGVDISRLGLMVVNGQPRTVAEYIQATSRVGRSTPGLVVTIHNLFRPRDRSHYERFSVFHEGFYRMVEASSVTPFSSRAIDRGLAGVTVALARHCFPLLSPPLGSERLDDVAGVATKVGEILADRVLAHQRGVTSEHAGHIRARVEALLGAWSASVQSLTGASVHLPYSPWEQTGPETLLRTAVDPPSEREPRLEAFRAPISMRDVEPGVHVWVQNRLGGGDP